MATAWRDVIMAGMVGAGLAAYLLLWFRWPVPAALGAAVLLAITVLVTARSLARDPGEADEAWRAAAPDLIEPPAGPRDTQSPRNDGDAR